MPNECDCILIHKLDCQKFNGQRCADCGTPVTSGTYNFEIRCGRCGDTRQRAAVMATLDNQPRTGKLLACPLCESSFMEIDVYQRRQGYLAEHLTWDHSLPWQEVFRLLHVENRKDANHAE